MATETARVPTANGQKYLVQLCKHWAHKLEVSQEGEEGTVRFADAVARMRAEPDALLVAVEAESGETVERIKGVVARHLDRFAFREAPLPFDWRAG